MRARSRGRVDLHTHSTASDGGLTPRRLVAAALRAGLKGLALTDHDTVAGLPAFLRAGARAGLAVLGGVEISVEHPGTFHLLGLNVAGGPEIPAALERLQAFRLERNRRMVERLAAQGFQVSWEELMAKAGNGQLGRPHFAALLVAKGYFATSGEVFDKLLGKGRPGYVDKTRLTPEAGLALVREAGWVSVLAHPVSLGLPPDHWPALLTDLTDRGLAGLEVYHPSHGPDETSFFRNLARQFGLVPTAGSDFHGALKPGVPLDWVRTHADLGWEMVETLRDRL